MSLTPEFLEDLKLLNMFSRDTTLQGIKIHSDADPARIAAGKRLFEKGLITLSDGGYLTPLGQEALEHEQALINMLRQPE